MRVYAFVALLFFFGCSGDDPEPIPCTERPVTLEVDATTSYMCGDGFESKVTIDNGSCETLTVGEISLVGVITGSTQCDPAVPSTYSPSVTSIPLGSRRTILDLRNTNPFCCRPPRCPNPYVCEERFTFEVETSAGTLTSSIAATISLGGCEELCQ